MPDRDNLFMAQPNLGGDEVTTRVDKPLPSKNEAFTGADWFASLDLPTKQKSVDVDADKRIPAR